MTALRFGTIGVLLGACHLKRLLAFEAARYVVTDKQHTCRSLTTIQRLSIFAMVAKQRRVEAKTLFGLPDPVNT
jgi:hypothetical protein